MRTAALYDIHGNLPALEAVLTEIEREKIDQIVVGGDVVPGPMPNETIARLRGLTIPTQFIQGNGDREVLAFKVGVESSAIPENFRESMSWNAQQLGVAETEWIASWPKLLRTQIDPIGEVLFCHATPRNDTDVFTRLTPDYELQAIFTELAVALVVCGHSHMQFGRTIGDVRVVNAGSVGMPFGKPGAYWLMLGPDIEMRRTTYDLAAVAARIRATNYPQAEEFASKNVLQPPTEESMLNAFTNIKLR